jgi:hypothetical protein
VCRMADSVPDLEKVIPIIRGSSYSLLIAIITHTDGGRYDAKRRAKKLVVCTAVAD